MNINVDIMGQLLPNVLTIAVQLCSTAVLFYFVKKLLWTPVRNMMEARAEAEQKLLDEAKNRNEESKALKETAEAEIIQAKRNAINIVESGREEGARVRKEIIENAHTEAQAIKKKAEQEIAEDRANMEREIQKEIVDVALFATEKLLNKKSNEEMDRLLVENFVKENSK